MRCVRVAAIGLLGAFLVLPAVATGQTSVTVGPMGGLALARFHGSDVNAFFARLPVRKGETSLAAGGFAELTVRPNVAVALQVLYVQNGEEAEGSSATGTFDLVYRVGYVEIPLLLKLFYGRRGGTRIIPSVFAGPAIGLKAKCWVKSTVSANTVEGTCHAVGGPDYDARSTDFSLVFGAGLDYGPVAFQARYDLGLSNIVSSGPATDVKTSAWVLTAGWRVPLRK